MLYSVNMSLKYSCCTWTFLITQNVLLSRSEDFIDFLCTKALTVYHH